MRAPLASRSLLFALAFSIAPAVTACSSPAAPPQTPSVEITRVQGGVAAGAHDAKGGSNGVATGDPNGAATGDSNGAAQTVQPMPRVTPPPGTATPPPAAGGPDRDADGIADTSDLCADVPEDRDAFQDADGCPDLDNDMDGIADMNDQCPNQPETKNGRQDADGCPD